MITQSDEPLHGKAHWTTSLALSRPGLTRRRTTHRPRPSTLRSTAGSSRGQGVAFVWVLDEEVRTAGPATYEKAGARNPDKTARI